MATDPTDLPAPSPAEPPAWAPLHHATFRALWIAQFVANIGTWAQLVAAQCGTAMDRDAEAAARRLVLPGTAPRVRHLLWAYGRKH